MKLLPGVVSVSNVVKSGWCNKLAFKKKNKKQSGWGEDVGTKNGQRVRRPRAKVSAAQDALNRRFGGGLAPVGAVVAAGAGASSLVYSLWRDPSIGGVGGRGASRTGLTRELERPHNLVSWFQILVADFQSLN